MALNKINRPALPYTPIKLPFYNRYSVLGRIPPSGDMLDADFDFVIDSINVMIDAINETAAGIFPGAGQETNANKLATTDGMGDVSWTFVTAENINVNAVQTQHIQDQNVTREKIQLNGIGTDQLDDKVVTSIKIADGAVTPVKLPDFSLPLSKWNRPKKASTICGSADKNGYWYEQELKDYQVITKKKEALGTTAVDLSYIWNASPSVFNGIKITPQSVDGEIVIKTKSTPLTALKSKNPSPSVVCGNANDKSLAEVSLGPLQVISLPSDGKTPVAMKLSEVFNNEDGKPFKGSKIAEGTTPVTALENAGQVAPFSMVSVLREGTIRKSLNVKSVTKTATGTYAVLFNTPASDNLYIVTFGMQGVNNYYMNAEVERNSCTVNGFTVITGYNQSTVDGEFYCVVYSF